MSVPAAPSRKPIWQPPRRHALPAITPGWLIPAGLAFGLVALGTPIARAAFHLFRAISHATGAGL